jgi:hypothetical protein
MKTITYIRPQWRPNQNISPSIMNEAVETLLQCLAVVLYVGIAILLLCF